MRYDHIGMLPSRAFSPVGKKMTLEGGGGKGGDMPDAPDYAALAQQQAQLQGQLIDKTTQANRVNQYTPYGSLEWSRGTSTPTFDQAAYDKAMAEYNRQTSSSANLPPRMGDPWRYLNPSSVNSIYQNSNNGMYTGYNNTGSIAMPKREDFMRGGGSGQWSATTKLTPELQAILDQNISAKGQSYDQLQQALGRINSDSLPKGPINPGQTAQDAIMARLDPTFQQEDERVRNRLYNQGVRPGTEAWDNEMRNFERARNDAYSQAALQGINLDFQNRNQSLQEQAIPINLINAYQNGSQAQMPQFQNYAQQANQTAPDLLGAAQSQYGAGLNSYNASQAAGSNFMSGLFGIGGAIGGAPSGSLFGNIGGALGRALGF